MTRDSLHIYLITHNKNVDYYLSLFNHLCAHLPLEVSFSLISNQEFSHTSNYFKGYIRVLFENFFTLFWNCSHATRFSLKAFKIFFVSLFAESFKYLTDSKFRQKILIRTVVTSKHYHAIESTSFCNYDYSLILEDDLYFLSADSFALHLQTIFKFLKPPFFVDIAGGYNLSNLRYSSLHPIFDSDNLSIYHIFPPQSNTACAYLFDKSFARSTHRLLFSHPFLRSFIGNDFLLNLVFLLYGSDIQCLHCSTDSISHGSFSGHTVSWTKKY